jgi:predicted metal-dependent phosphoesterase TrpH
VARRQASLESAKQATRESGGVLVLAHPHLNLSSGNIHSLVDDGIDGLETDHPKLKASQSRELALLAQEKGLLATGGSDYHGERRGPLRVGAVRVPLEVVDRIEAIAARRIRDRESNPASFIRAGEP